MHPLLTRNLIWEGVACCVELASAHTASFRMKSSAVGERHTITKGISSASITAWMCSGGPDMTLEMSQHTSRRCSSLLRFALNTMGSFPRTCASITSWVCG